MRAVPNPGRVISITELPRAEDVTKANGLGGLGATRRKMFNVWDYRRVRSQREPVRQPTPGRFWALRTLRYVTTAGGASRRRSRRGECERG